MTKFDNSLPVCVIADIDGTLAIRGNRGPFDLRKVDQDHVKQEIADIVNQFSEFDKIFLFSGRDGSSRELTEKWLRDNGIKYDELHMREPGNGEKDAIIKKRMYEEHILGKYNVRFVLDDRDQVVDMWRKELGLTCLQVNYGNF